MFRKLLVVPSLCAGIIFAAAMPCTLTAQAPGPLPGQSTSQWLSGEPVSTTAPHAMIGATTTAGPRLAAVAFHISPARTDFVVAAQDSPHGGLGGDLALVGVGAVATFAGLKIGGGAGGVIAVGGAALALYGLYHFLK